MVTLPFRIRRSRRLSSLTQSALAERLEVKRSAVSQWESPSGTTPSVPHLIRIAMETGVSFEWLATGRGAARPQQDGFDEAALLKDFARDELESRALLALARLPRPRKSVAVAIIELLGGIGPAQLEGGRDAQARTPRNGDALHRP